MKDFIKLTKDMVTLWITESRTWEVNQEHKFQFEDWYLSFKRAEDTYAPYVYEISGVNRQTDSTMTRRYRTPEAALLHVMNHFNENAALSNPFSSIAKTLDMCTWFKSKYTQLVFDTAEERFRYTINGELTEEQKTQIVSCLEEGKWFIPDAVGIDDGEWGEWNEFNSFTTTTLAPSKCANALTPEELVAAFQKMHDGWRAAAKFDIPKGKRPYLVEIAETHYKTVMVVSENRTSAEDAAYTLLDSKDITFEAEQYSNKDVKCTGIATADDMTKLELYGTEK